MLFSYIGEQNSTVVYTDLRAEHRTVAAHGPHVVQQNFYTMLLRVRNTMLQCIQCDVFQTRLSVQSATQVFGILISPCGRLAMYILGCLRAISLFK